MNRQRAIADWNLSDLNIEYTGKVGIYISVDDDKIAYYLFWCIEKEY